MLDLGGFVGFLAVRRLNIILTHPQDSNKSDMVDYMCKYFNLSYQDMMLTAKKGSLNTEASFFCNLGCAPDRNCKNAQKICHLLSIISANYLTIKNL